MRDARCRRVRGAALPQSRYGPWAPRRFRSRGHEAFRQCSAGQGGWPCRFHAASERAGAVPYKSTNRRRSRQLLDAETCIRCGLCARTCQFGSLIPRHMP
ncbi:MAG: 4Fe-4S binding protein [Bilophila wadsworthia]